MAYTPSQPTRHLAALIAAGILISIACYSAAQAYTDQVARSGAPEDLKRACGLAPWNSDYALWYARAESGDPGPTLRRAVELNSYNAAAWIDMGLHAELAGDLAGAEHALLIAANRDRTFQPAWTLANYYCRRQRRADFAIWTSRAASMLHDDPKPLFELCRQASDDSRFILNEALPATEPILRAYLEYLVARNLWEDSAEVAGRLIEMAKPADAAPLLAYCDIVINAGQSAAHLLPSAYQVWNALCERKIVPYSPLNAARGSLTNSTFTYPTLDHAFDWRILPNLPGVEQTFTAPGWRINLSGNQAEHCVLLLQFVPAVKRARYQLRTRMPGDRVPGLAWHAVDALTGDEIAATDEDSDTLDFRSPSSLLRLSLEYHRRRGTVRSEASVRLENVELVRLP